MSGDPLCPYIFILCVEELFMLIKDVEKKAKVHEVKICMDALVVSHLVFADDSVLFFRDDEREVVVVRKILYDYAEASGQYINQQKFEVTFSRNVNQGLKNDVRMTEGNGGGKYLGFLSFVGMSKKGMKKMNSTSF